MSERPHVIAPYKPLDWQQAPLRDKSRVILLTGTAGGGKSVCALQKAHAFALHYPEATVLLMRKDRASMINSTIVQYETDVVGRDPHVRHMPSKSRFEYANGSMALYAGMNDDEARERIKSIGIRGGLDFAVMEEGTSCEEADYNMVLTRLRGTAVERYLYKQYLAACKQPRRAWTAHAGRWYFPYLRRYGPTPNADQRETVWQHARRLGWQQIVIATNPDSPLHWIYRRLIQGGEAKVYISDYRDNPHNALSYTETINMTTGVEHDRMAMGLWVQATGIIYDTFSLSESVGDDADYLPGGGPIYWAVDDGYAGERDKTTGLYTGPSHPRVFLVIQQRTDGGYNVVDEHHAILTDADKHLGDVMALPYGLPDWAAVDKAAAQLKGRLFNAGIYTKNSPSSVEESIKELRSALAADANGWRKIRIHPRCKLLISEFGHYRRDANGRPVKQYDHALDALRYFAWRVRGT